MVESEIKNNGVYVTLDELMKLQFNTSGFRFLPKQAITSVLSGRHASRLRGRGLNFEELRGYLPGDDIRNIDWKVTARTQKPHVRVYTEEKERPAIVVVDQRMSMFFGTQKDMKSVTAANLAALTAWKIIDGDDKVGSIVFNDSEIEEIKPQRNKKNSTLLFESIVKFNNKLNVNSGYEPNPSIINSVLEQVSRIAKHDYLVCVISDFHGMDEISKKHLINIAEHNDVISFLVYDVAALNIPKEGKFVFSENELQIEVDFKNKKSQAPIANYANERLKNVDKILKDVGIPIFRINNVDDISEQLRIHLGIK